MKFDDMNLRKIIEALYLNMGCKLVNERYAITIDGINDKNNQPCIIPVVHSNPFQAISLTDRVVPCIYFTVDIADDDQRYHQWRAKYIHRNEDDNGVLQSIDVKMEGDPVNYTFNLTGEVRSDTEGVLLMKYFRKKFDKYGGRFLFKDITNQEIFSYTYTNVAHQRTRDMFNIITNNIVITSSFDVLGYFDFHDEVKKEKINVDKLIMTAEIIQN